MRGPAILLLAGLLAASSGCTGLRHPFHWAGAAMPKGVSWQATPRAAAPQRIAVLPFWLAAGVGRSAAVTGDNLAASLGELGLHEVSLVSGEERSRLLADDPLAANRLAAADLLRLRDALRCDAVLLGRVEQYDSYEPVSIRVSCHLVSCLDGEVLWSAAGHFDGARADVQQDVEAWYRSRGEATVGIAGWKGVLASPRAFTRYLCDRLAGTMAGED